MRAAGLLIVSLGAALDHVLLTVAPSLGWLFVGRVIAGLTGASFSAARAAACARGSRQRGQRGQR